MNENPNQRPTTNESSITYNNIFNTDLNPYQNILLPIEEIEVLGMVKK